MRPGRGFYDLALIGGGTGGLVAAMIAAAVGAKTVLIERERTGGDCLWTGCVPSKSVLAAADLAHRIRHGDAVGLTPTEPGVDFARVMAHVRGARVQIAPQDSPERLRCRGRGDRGHGGVPCARPHRRRRPGASLSPRSSPPARGPRCRRSPPLSGPTR